MTPERKLIEAVLEAYDGYSVDSYIDHILATPAVQTALAEVRGQAIKAVCYEYDEDPMVRDVEAWLAANPPPKPEPVLRWKGDRLLLGIEDAGAVWSTRGDSWAWHVMGRCCGTAATEAEARTAAEQAVRDWLKRAGCA